MQKNDEKFVDRISFISSKSAIQITAAPRLHLHYHCSHFTHYHIGN